MRQLVGGVFALFPADQFHQVTHDDCQSNTNHDGNNRVFIDERNLADDCHANNGQHNKSSLSNLSGGVLHDVLFSSVFPVFLSMDKST